VYDDKGRAGSNDTALVVRKPLMVKAVLPRFVHPGDALRVSAQIHNGTTHALTVDLQAAFLGLALRSSGKAATTQAKTKTKTKTGTHKRHITIAPGHARQVAFAVHVTDPKRVRVRFSARAGDAKDAVERTIPVLDPGNRRRHVISGVIGGKGDLSVDLPADRIAGSERLSILAASSSLSELKGAVDYLMTYPNGCIEQTTSSAYPLVVLEDLLPEIGVRVDEAKLKTYRDAGIKRLLAFQTTSGGLAYWPGSDKPHAFGTAFGLTAILAAKDRGYDIPQKFLESAATYLVGVLSHGPISEKMPHEGLADADTRVFIVMTLGRLGHPRPGDVEALWRQRAKLGAFGLAFLAIAAQEGPPEGRALVTPILAELQRRGIEKTKEAYYGGKRRGGWSLGSPLRAHATALLAFAKTGPKKNFGAKLLIGLLARRRGGLWGNTQENVFGIMGIASFVGKPTAKAPSFALQVNGKAVVATRFARLGKGTRQLTLTSADSELRRGRGVQRQTIAISNQHATPLHVSLRADYAVPLTGKYLNATSHGFSVVRRYETPKGRRLNPQAIRLGAIVRVRLRVKADKKQNYVAITDRLPAGLEPINATLATSARVAGGKPSRAQLRGHGLLSFSELRDQGAAFFIDALPAGVIEVTYLARAMTPGNYLRPAAHVEAMYDPHAEGRTRIDHVRVVRR
ncbi:MAG: hypothetical protein KAI47_14320, partial [Deltaproteobacteria bacterium]|nr:hypothetical protein [Deltaproteobacteria bacterium]